MSDPATPSEPEQPERPDSGQPDDTPDTSGTPSSGSPGIPEDARELDEPRAKSDRPPDTAGDAWASSVDKPSSTRQPMGFSSPGSSSSSSDDDDEDDDFGELGDLGGMLQQLLGGLGGGAGGSGQMPDLGELFKMLGGAQGGSGQLPDLGELMRQFGGLQGQGLPGGAAGMDQLRQLWKQLGIDPDDPSSAGMLAMVQQQVQQFLNPKDAGDRRRMETDLARKTVATETDPVVTAAQQRAVGDAVRLAQLWLDPVTTLDPVHGEGLAWSRSEWVEATMPKWHELVEPVADGVTLAMTTAMDEQFSRLTSEGLGDGIQGLPEIPGLDLSSLLGQLQPALKQLASGMFSAQLGNGVGALAADLLTATEVGLPLLTTPDVALLPTNITPFTVGSGIDANEVLIYLAVRESARARLFAQVPWLGPQLEAAVRDYARNIRIDTDAIEEQMRSIDLQNIGAMQEALRDRLFSPTPTRGSRPPWPGWRPRSPSSRAGSTSSPTRPPAGTCRRPPRSARRYGGAGPAGLRRRRSPGWSVSSCGRVGSDARTCGPRWRTPAAGGCATRRGRTRTSRRRLPTSTTRSATSRSVATSGSTDEMDAALDALLRAEPTGLRVRELRLPTQVSRGRPGVELTGQRKRRALRAQALSDGHWATALRWNHSATTGFEPCAPTPGACCRRTAGPNPGRRAGAAAPGLARPPRRASRRDGEVGPASAPHGQLHRAGRRGSSGCC